MSYNGGMIFSGANSPMQGNAFANYAGASSPYYAAGQQAQANLLSRYGAGSMAFSRAGASFGAPGVVGGGMSGGGAGGMSGDINSLLARQQQQNDQARAQNQANWDQGKNLLLGAQSAYQNDPAHQGAAGLVGGLLANPEAINDRTEAAIQNNAAAGINARTNASLRTQQGMLAANGSLDPSSMAAIQERANRQSQAQMTQSQTGLDVQRALQRNQDIMNAANMGNQLAGQNFGVNAGTANSFLQNMPQYKPDDLSGYIAGFSQFQRGSQLGGAPAGGGGMGGNGMGGYNYLQHNTGNGFSSQGLPANVRPANRGGTTSFGPTPDMTYNTGYNSQADNGQYY